MTWTARHFKPSEFDSPDEPGSGARMNPVFVGKLDAVRGFCGFALRVSKGGGFRTSAYNTKIKGAKTSSHLRGEAADIPCADVSKRYIIVAAAIAAGIKSIEICNGHIHLDHRTDKFRMWIDLSR